MTIIIATADGMAADSASWRHDIMRPSPEPKIVRLAGGELLGACGASSDCAAVRAWARAWFDQTSKPTLSFTDPASDHSVLWLLLDAAGDLWMGDCTLNRWRVPVPTVIGYGAEFAYGTLAAGASLEATIRETIRVTPYLGGEPQIETLAAPAPFLPMQPEPHSRVLERAAAALDPQAHAA